MKKNIFLLIGIFLIISNYAFSATRGSSIPYISGDTFREYSDHTYDELNRSLYPKKLKDVKDGDIIFVKTDYLNTFFKIIHKKINSKYILITHNSDHAITKKYIKYLQDDKLLAWFCQNLEIPKEKKIHPIPIGIANKCFVHGNVDEIINIQGKLPKNERSTLLYMNFSVDTNYRERSIVSNLFKNKKYCVVELPKEYSAYLNDLSHAKFVLSPSGKGLDCHRTWEALLMGAIPIIKKSTLDPMFENMPVLIVDDWKVINKRFLEKSYEKMQKRSFDIEKIYFAYWWSLIESYRS